MVKRSLIKNNVFNKSNVHNIFLLGFFMKKKHHKWWLQMAAPRNLKYCKISSIKFPCLYAWTELSAPWRGKL